VSKMVRTPFNPRGDFTALREFRFAGRTFEPGDPFPWRRLGCSARRLRQLYEGRKLLLKEDDLDEELMEEEILDQSEDSVEDEGLVFDPDVHDIENPGRGVWLMTVGEKTIVQLTPKEAKRLRKKTEPTEVNMEEVLED
jgi:hypothetical protein